MKTLAVAVLAGSVVLIATGRASAQGATGAPNSVVQAGGTQAQPQPAETKDPVCGMKVDPAKALKETYKNKTYYFCSDTCQKKFKQDPEKYIKKDVK
jgi:YHS domain-containing protein